MKHEDYHALVKEFDQKALRTKPGQGGKRLSYVSHGSVTERLNQVDPGWSMETRATYTYAGKDGRLHVEGVEIALTVCGVTRVEAGGPQRQDGFTNEIKNAYSDALKRAAMRFGVALTIWESSVEAQYDEDAHPDYEPPAPQQPRPTPRVAPQDARQAPAAPIPPEPLTDAQERTVAEARDMAEARDTLGAVDALLRALKPAATPGQWKTISARRAKLVAEFYPESLMNGGK